MTTAAPSRKEALVSERGSFRATRCAICRTLGNATELYQANFDRTALNPAVFSARRLPDRIHFRLVRCDSCGLIRSDPSADPELLHRLYTRSSFDYEGEVDHLRRTYGHYLERVRHHLSNREDIGNTSLKRERRTIVQHKPEARAKEENILHSQHKPDAQAKDFRSRFRLVSLRRTFARASGLYRRCPHTDRGRSGHLLEIGCGNGFFLDEARRRGFEEVRGVEPSAAAVAGAPADLRPWIIRDVMRPGLFAAASFDVVCLFQVFDHVPEPAALLEECFRVLRPGGMVLCLNHNVDALSARLLGDKSPIIDIEHTYLYSPETLRKLFTNAGFVVVESGRAWNRYSLYYLARLVPLPGRLKAAVLGLLRGSGIGKLPLWVALGNLYQIARKPNPE